MRNRKRPLYAASIVVVMLALACKSQPAVEEPPAPPQAAAEPAPSGVDQAALDALAQARKRTETVRQLIMDFEGPEGFPEDWKACESLYHEAEGAEKQNRDAPGVALAEERFKAAAEGYEAMKDKTLERYFQEKRGEIARLRTAVAESGLPERRPGALEKAKAAEERAEEAYAKGQESGDLYPAKDLFYAALELYQALEVDVLAEKARGNIISKGLYEYGAQDVDAADAAAEEGRAAYDADDPATALAKAGDALALYRKALAPAMAALVSEAADAAARERETAVGLKANVALRTDFAATDALYGRAKTAHKNEQWEEAAELYGQAARQFTSLGRKAEEKRVAAEAAMRKAETKMKESERVAVKADAILEGDEK